MTTLAQLQQAFFEYLCEDNSAIQDEMGNSQLAKQRLQIYADAYAIRLTEALLDDFPVCATWLMTAQFKQYCHQYIKQYQSKSYSIRWFGQHFSHFLQQQNHPDATLLSELAQFEWALHVALDAKDAKPLQDHELKALAPEQWAALRLGFHPSVQCLSFNYPIVQLYKSLKQSQPFSHKDYAPSPQTIMVWRTGLVSRYESLSQFQVKLYQSIASKLSFSEICEDLCQSYSAEKVPTLIIQHLQHWLNQEVLINTAAAVN